MKIVLIVAYLSYNGIPSIAMYERTDMKQCRQEAQFIFNAIKAGSGRAWCHRVIDWRTK